MRKSSQTYEVSFSFSPRPDTVIGDNILEFRWDGTLKDTITRAGGGTNDWSAHSYNLAAASETMELRFTDVGTHNSLGTFLDKVSVRCIPEDDQPECGNNIVEEGEECDGSAEFGFFCTESCGLIEAECGDGAINLIGEECDDGNIENGDGCDVECQNEDSVCGNEIVEDGEACDKGETGDSTCTAGCELTFCGDGVKQSPNGHDQNEECDGSAPEGFTCSQACLLEEIPFECTTGTLWQIGYIEATQLDNPADELNWPGVFGFSGLCRSVCNRYQRRQ